VNTLWCTWRNVVVRWRAGRREPSAYAAALIHLGLLVALLAHLVGGLANREGGQVVVGASPVDLGDGRRARLVRLDIEPQADGSPKSVRATLELSDAAGVTTPAVVGYNEPLSRALGSDLWLLVRPIAGRGGMAHPGGEAVILRRRVAPGNPVALVAVAFMLLGTALMWRRVV